MKRVAIFIDWDNFRKELEKVIANTNTKLDDFDYNNLTQLMKLIKSFINDTEEELYRIFIYTAHPLSYKDVESELKKRNISQNEIQLFSQNKQKIDSTFVKAKKFIDNIALQEYVALRKGILKIGAICNGEVTINQKQVDMLIGLDIAQLSYESRVDKIIVCSKDTDMKPAIKVARINGIHTVISKFKEIKQNIPKELREHTDTIREISFVDFVNNLKNN